MAKSSPNEIKHFWFITHSHHRSILEDFVSHVDIDTTELHKARTKHSTGLELEVLLTLVSMFFAHRATCQDFVS